MIQFRVPCAAASLVLALLTGISSLSLHAEDEVGRKLFVDRWSAHDKRSFQGDGLGPMHNATSCAACHHQAGPGGGGAGQHNVQLLSVVPVDPHKAGAKDLSKRLIALHPGFKIDGSDQARPNIVLHRFGAEGDYFDFRAKLLGIEEPRADVDPARRAVVAVALAKRRRNIPPVEALPPVHGIAFTLSQRNTPALWGAGLIDAISDTVIKENAESQKLASPEVAGRAPRATGGGVGRFGWRGQTDSLRQFVMIACANELGLQTKDHPQPLNPLSSEYRLAGHDMSDTEIDAMVRFVGNLAKPIEVKPATPLATERARKGEEVFNHIGCAVCHPRELGKVGGLFSDLLLHDLGPSLSDPVEPNPDVDIVERRGFGYSGTGSIFTEKERPDATLPQQWRTPPLWGVRDSAPYLHDGRAATLLAAITQHGGQAAASTSKFNALTSVDRICLIGFLETLQAPPAPAK